MSNLSREPATTRHFESVNEPEEQAESEGPEEGQLDLQDKQDSSFESPGRRKDRRSRKVRKRGNSICRTVASSPPRRRTNRRNLMFRKTRGLNRRIGQTKSRKPTKGRPSPGVGKLRFRSAGSAYRRDRSRCRIIRQLREKSPDSSGENGELLQQLEDKDQVINGLQPIGNVSGPFTTTMLTSLRTRRRFNAKSKP